MTSSYTVAQNAFPFPSNIARLNSIGMHYYTYRQTVIQIHQEGLTKIYNRCNNSHEKAQDIIELRELHHEMVSTSKARPSRQKRVGVRFRLRLSKMALGVARALQ
jgi:hypothetical protein